MRGAGAGQACHGGLQWVHGPRTVVMGDKEFMFESLRLLQWVHGPRTVVMTSPSTGSAASAPRLQWVHGPRTVVMGVPHNQIRGWPWGFNGFTVREPWLWKFVIVAAPPLKSLQWVHG